VALSWRRPTNCGERYTLVYFLGRFYTSYTELLYPMTSLLVLNSLASGSVLLATIRRTLGQNGNKRVSEQSTWEMYIQAISGSVSSQRSTVNELRWQTGNIVRHPTHCPKYMYSLSLSLWAPIDSSHAINSAHCDGANDFPANRPTCEHETYTSHKSMAN